MRNFLCMVALLLFAVPSWAQVTVTGEGKVSAVPNMATVVLVVISEHEQASIALDKNSVSMSNLTKSLESLGVTKQEMRTDLFQVNPKYAYPQGQEPKFVGHVVTNSLTITVCQSDTLGKILDSAIKNGANKIESVSWGFKDPEDLLNQARVEAVKDAKSKATLLLNTAGSQVGALVSVSENERYIPIRQLYTTSGRADLPRGAAIEAGMQTLRVNITVVWSVGPPVK